MDDLLALGAAAGSPKTSTTPSMQQRYGTLRFVDFSLQADSNSAGRVLFVKTKPSGAGSYSGPSHKNCVDVSKKPDGGQDGIRLPG